MVQCAAAMAKRLLHCLVGLKRSHSCCDDEEEVVVVAVVQEVAASEQSPCRRGSVVGRQIVLRGCLWGMPGSTPTTFASNRCTPTTLSGEGEIPGPTIDVQQPNLSIHGTNL